MSKQPSKGKANNTPLEERLRIAREINQYRAAHKGMRLKEVMKAFPGVREGQYHAWNTRLKLAEATRKANGEAQEAQHFPLAAIPEKPKKQPQAKPAAPRARDEDKQLAASLLEVAARLLKR